ncbi:MAG TPA: SPFH domain-containing protein [Ktedonobacteraceae bacterium]|nr:SPFH domain-containing protein [Ktedonobacteraceae bacterium]
MGFLADWGIKRLANAEQDMRRVGQALGFMPLSWRDVVTVDPSRDGVMWRIPDPNVPRASALRGVQAIVVSHNELVIVLRDGKLDAENQAILEPGLYDIKQLTALRGRIEVIWFTMGEFQLPWGVGDVLTLEGEAVGAFGMYRVKVVNPVQFLESVARNWQVYTKKQLGEELTRSSVNSVVGGAFASRTIRELKPQQAEISLACKEALLPTFEDWGLEFCGLTIDIKYPDGYLETLRMENRVSLEMQARLTGGEASVRLAALKAQEEQYRILTEANKVRALGNANVEVMQNQLNAGINPLELEKIKAIEILAANPGEGMLVDNRPQIVNQLLPQPPMPPIGPVIVAGNPFVQPMPQQQLNQQGALPSPVNMTPAGGGSGEAMTREKIEEMLDKLDERFANGEISEQVYLTLQAKWQNRLEKLS